MSNNSQFIDMLIGEVVFEPLKAGQPLPVFTTPRQDAQDWAEWALPQELEAYASECLKRASTDAQKRIFWQIWQSFSDAEQAAFLNKIKVAA